MDLFETLAQATKPRFLKWELKFNNQSIGKQFFTKSECKKEFKRLWKLNLYGYTIHEIK